MNYRTQKVGKRRKKVLFSSSPFYFDDCPICRAMKKAEEIGRNLTEQELRKGFRKAGEKDLSKN